MSSPPARRPPLHHTADSLTRKLNVKPLELDRGRLPNLTALRSGADGMLPSEHHSRITIWDRVDKIVFQRGDLDRFVSLTSLAIWMVPDVAPLLDLLGRAASLSYLNVDWMGPQPIHAAHVRLPALRTLRAPLLLLRDLEAPVLEDFEACTALNSIDLLSVLTASLWPHLRSLDLRVMLPKTSERHAVLAWIASQTSRSRVTMMGR